MSVFHVEATVAQCFMLEKPHHLHRFVLHKKQGAFWKFLCIPSGPSVYLSIYREPVLTGVGLMGLSSEVEALLAWPVLAVVGAVLI